jgi:glyoxylase-like metal-dependent hydrolase (beta-lactamase superfamily II)
MTISIKRPIADRNVSTSYVVTVDREIIVIDTGAPGNGAAINSAVNQAQSSGAVPKAILVTHSHPDHAGSLADIAASLNVPVMASAHDAERITSGRSQPKPTCKRDLFSRLLYWRIIEKSDPHFKPASVSHQLTDGDRLPFCGGIDVVALPGHSAGQLGFLLRAHGAFFVGDALNNIVRPALMNWHEDAAAEVTSVKRIASLAWTTLYVGHGKPITRQAFDRFAKRPSLRA